MPDLAGDVRLLTFAPEQFVTTLDDPDNPYHAKLAEAATALAHAYADQRLKASQQWIASLHWPPSELERLAVVTLRRCAHVANNRQILGDMTFFAAASTLDYLLAALLDVPIPWSRASIIALLTDVNRCSVYCPARRVFAIAREHVETHGFDPELLTAFRTFESGNHGSLSAQDLRAQVALYLLRDDITPIDPKRCWSEIVRASLASMSRHEKTTWHRLLDTVSPTQTQKPSKSWLKLARQLHQTLGPTFSQRIAEWFAPFSNDTTLNLTTEGSHLLRHLLWYCSLSSEMQTYAARIALAPWKQTQKVRATVAKVAITAAWVLEQLPPQQAAPHLEALDQAFGSGGTKIKESLDRVTGIKPTTPDAAPRSTTIDLSGFDLDKIGALMAKRVVQTLPGGDRVSWDGDQVIIRGDLDSYRLRENSPYVTRLSDGAVAELDHTRLPHLGVNATAPLNLTLWTRCYLLTQDEPHQFRQFEGS
jgi:hypothetical protein